MSDDRGATEDDWWERRKAERERPRYEDRPKGTGDYTGRCWRCGSSDLWDDETAYGCNACKMIRCFG